SHPRVSRAILAEAPVLATLDQHRWAVRESCTGYGLRIGIRANNATALAAIVDCLPPGLERNDLPEVDMLYSVVVPDSQPMNGSEWTGGAYANSAALTRAPNVRSIVNAVEHHLTV